MIFRDLLADTLRTLWAHKLRTFLTMFGIAWGIISITLMVAAVNGLGEGLRKQHETLGKDIMIVFAGRTSLQAGGMRAGRAIRWNDDDYIPVQEESPACRYVLPEVGNNAPIRSRYNSGDLLVTGSLPAFAEVRSIHVAEGRFYDEGDNAGAVRVAFLGSDAKKQLFGTREVLGETIWMADIPYKVIGVMKEKDQNSSYDGFDVRKVFVPYSAMILDFPNRPPSPAHSIDRLLVVPKSLALHGDCERQLRTALGLIHHFDPHDKEAAGIWDTVKEAKANQMIIDGMEWFLGAVGVTTLFLGGLGVMNVMLVSVRERTREIGVRMALGATPGGIAKLVMARAGRWAAAGIVLGLAGSFFAARVMRALLYGVKPGDPPTLAGVTALLLAIALAAAWIPARRAALIDPVEALREE